MIEKIAHIYNTNSTVFEVELNKKINEMQELGLKTDVQYSVASYNKDRPAVIYTALITGRRQ